MVHRDKDQLPHNHAKGKDNGERSLREKVGSGSRMALGTADNTGSGLQILGRFGPILSGVSLVDPTSRSVVHQGWLCLDASV